MPLAAILVETTKLMDDWYIAHSEGSDRVEHILTRLAEIVEQQTLLYKRTDPDPFDERHPSRADPSSTYGHVLKAILKQDDFIMELFTNYIPVSNRQSLHEVTCRLMIDLLPASESEAVFKDEGAIQRLFSWVESGSEPLATYAAGLLAPTMDIKENASTFKEKNYSSVPLMLKRLRELAFGDGPKESEQVNGEKPASTAPLALLDENSSHKVKRPSGDADNAEKGIQRKKLCLRNVAETMRLSAEPADCSNSSWSEQESLLITGHQVFPVTDRVKEEMILTYLTSLGEYQDLLPHVYEHNVMELIKHYIDHSRHPHYARVSFLALRYLASMFCHKKLSIEFVQSGGIQLLLSVPRPSLAATGSSMCLFYLGYYEEVMERIVCLPSSVLSELVAGILWLLECSHPSGRIHSVMFFQNTLQFGAIFRLFEEKDGLRRLLNLVSVLPTIVGESLVDGQGNNRERTDDDIQSDRQTVKHAWITLHRYMESHLVFRVEKLRMIEGARFDGVQALTDHKFDKALPISPEAEKELIDYLAANVNRRSHPWEPVNELLSLGGIDLLLKTLAKCKDWQLAYKAEVMIHALDVLSVCSSVPACQLKMVEPLQLPDNHPKTTAISLVLHIIAKDGYQDPLVYKSALRLLANLVGGEKALETSLYRHVTPLKLDPRSEPLSSRMWNEMRRWDGVMILLKTLEIKVPILHADDIRALACSALVGLSRSDHLCQIMSKLPLFNTGQLQQLMRAPLHQDSRQEHARFCRHATLLMERVCGRPKSAAMDASLEHIRRADVVAQTRIVYHERELLQLVHAHLHEKGLELSARALADEVGLPPIAPTTPPPQPVGALLFTTPSVPGSGAPLTAEKPSHSNFIPAPPPTPTSSTVRSTPATPIMTSSGLRFLLNAGANSSVCATPTHTPPTTSSLSSKILNSASRHKHRGESAGCSTDLAVMNSAGAASGGGYQELSTATSGTGHVSLDKIVTSYLSQQHSLCKNPVSTCPPFSLFEPHVCPTAARRHYAPHSVMARLGRREYVPNRHAADSIYLNRKFIYSRFRPARVFKDSNETANAYSCCAISPCEQWLMLGTNEGELKLYNMVGGDEAETYNCHQGPMTRCEPSRDGTLVLTSSSFGNTLSALWSMGTFFEVKTNFDEERYVEFSKYDQKQIVATKDSEARIYDVETGRLERTLYDASKANHYSSNQATYSVTDEFVLSDGVLWVADSAKPLHKFDKFNDSCYSGVFHPNGFEVIINSQVWDLRMFHLLHTVPDLDQCQLRFSHRGDVIYGAVLASDDDDELGFPGRNKSPYGSTFRTFDARDYSNLATIDVRRTIFDLCCDKTDTHLAVVESQKPEDNNMPEDSVCRLYEIGRVKTLEDEMEMEDDVPMDEEDEEAGDDMEVADFVALANAVNNGPNDSGDDTSSTSGDSSSDDSGDDDALVVPDSDGGGSDDDDDDDDDDAVALFHMLLDDD